MNGSRSRDGLLLKTIEMAYAAVDDGEMGRAVFMALRDVIQFRSGVLMPVSPHMLELQHGMCFDCRAADMETYLAHYAPLDPFVLRQPSPTLLNRTVRFSDVITTSELERSEFSEFMRQVPYHHALGILAGVAQQPVAVFSVHRHRDEKDFSAADLTAFDCIGPHLARAMTLRHQVSDPQQRTETGILVVGVKGKILYLNAPARAFLGPTPPQAVLAALPAQGTGVIALGSQRFRLNRMPWAAASLLHRFAMGEAAAEPIDGRRPGEGPVERWSAATRGEGGAIILVLQPFRQRIDLTRRLANCRLSSRQTEIAVWALRGLANGEIARRVFIGEQTVMEHCQEIYCRVGVRTRAELLAKVLGTSGEIPTGPGE